MLRKLYREFIDLILAFCVVFVILIAIDLIPETWGPWATVTPMVLFAYFILKFMQWRER